MKAKILITEPDYFPEKALAILRRIGDVAAKRPGTAGFLEELQSTDILVVRVETAVDRKLLDSARRLKIIGSATTGLEHIDTEYAKERGIKIISLSGAHTITTAEHAMSLMLSLSRKLPWAFNNMLAGRWERHKFIGTLLSGKVLGIIGFGRIGRRVAEYARALGMDVLFYDPYVEGAVEHAQKADLKGLLKASDVVSVHADFRGKKPIIGKSELELMKPSAFIINTSRGKLVDESSLLDALANGVIAGAALDVYSEEPLPPSSPLIAYARAHENLILTPHIGASTKEAVEEASVHIAEEISKAWKTGPA